MGIIEDILHNLLLCPSLNKDEKDIILNIYPILHDESVKKFGENFNGDEDKIIEVFLPKVTGVIDILKTTTGKFKKFTDNYKKWRKARVKAINLMYSIAKKINLDRKNCNISRLTGSLAGAGAGAALIFSVFVPVAAPIVVGALATSVVSGLTVGGTTITEFALLKREVSNFQRAWKEDEENFQPIKEWIEHSQEMLKAFDSAMAMNIFETLFEDLKAIPQDIKTAFKFVADEKDKLLDKLHPIILKMCQVFSMPFNTVMYVIPIMLSVFIAFFMIRRRNCHLFDALVMLQRVIVGLAVTIDVSVELGRAVGSITLKGGAAAAVETLSKTSVRTVAAGLVGIGVALDVINIVQTSIDIHEGSRSEVASNITEAADKLKGELDVLDDIYNSMRVN